MQGYKVFDENLQCRGYQFEVGKTFEIEGELQICKNGFHFCEKLVDCFNYYNFDPKNRVCIVEADMILEDYDKCATNKIKIIKELTWEEVLLLCNSGNYNSGYCNSGNRNSGNRNSGNHNSGNYNSGYCNSGNWNSGNRNSGNHNSGNYNSGNYNSGYFNTDADKIINVFNKPCKKEVFDSSYHPDFLFFAQQEGETYKQAFIRSFEGADKVDRMKIKDIPNFDKDVFFELSGIDISKYE